MLKFLSRADRFGRTIQRRTRERQSTRAGLGPEVFARLRRSGNAVKVMFKS